MLLVLAAVHLRPLPVAVAELQHEGNDPGAIVLQVVRGPPDGLGIKLLISDYLSLLQCFLLNSDNALEGFYLYPLEEQCNEGAFFYFVYCMKDKW